jgi:sugar lactone lactonase YvrE
MTAAVVEVDAHEGPVYVPDEDALYFTSVPAPEVAIKRPSLVSGEVSVLRVDADAANGMAVHPDGRLLACEQGTRSSPAREPRRTAWDWDRSPDLIPRSSRSRVHCPSRRRRRLRPR